MFFIIFDFSFGWVEPPVQATISREAPPSVNATMMATMKASSMLSYFVLGWLGRFYEPMGAPLYWLFTAAIAASAALFMLVFGKVIVGMLGAGER